MAFDIGVDRMIFSASDATDTFDVGEDLEDVVNEVGSTRLLIPPMVRTTCS